ncbi:MAG: hypothetical protein PVH61_38110 [Candidatus Aminicenantes bacterium]|jgi:hypothetical protein
MTDDSRQKDSGSVGQLVSASVGKRLEERSLGMSVEGRSFVISHLSLGGKVSEVWGNDHLSLVLGGSLKKGLLW